MSKKIEKSGKKELNILGTVYTLEIKHKEEDAALESCSGYCDRSSHRMVVEAIDDSWTIDNPEDQQKKTIRHEIVHAYMYESGLCENWEHKTLGQEETTVDWFAYQGIKIYNTWKEACAI